MRSALDWDQNWSWFSKRCHSRVNQTSVSRKGVLSLNIIVLADEFGVQDVRRPNKLNSEI